MHGGSDEAGALYGATLTQLRRIAAGPPEVTERQRLIHPPDVGHRGWGGLRLDRDPDEDEVALAEAYRLAAPPGAGGAAQARVTAVHSVRLCTLGGVLSPSAILHSTEDDRDGRTLAATNCVPRRFHLPIIGLTERCGQGVLMT